MSYTREEINTEIEQNLIIGLITKTEVLAGILPHFKPRYLTIPYMQVAARMCLDYFGQYGAAPGPHIRNIFIAQQKTMDPDQSAMLEGFLCHINERYTQLEGELNPDFLLKESIKYLQERAVTCLIDDLEQHRQTGNIAAAVEAVQGFRAMTGPREALKPGYTGAEMLRATFTEPKWIVKDLIPQGFSPLCGPPKVGKSWLALNLALCIATGSLFLGRYQVEQGAALYLDFELPHVKVKERLKKCLGGQFDPPGLENLYLQPSGSWSRIHQGGLAKLEEFVKVHPDLKLVVIDVWRKFSRPRKAQEENSYSLTYEDVGRFSPESKAPARMLPNQPPPGIQLGPQSKWGQLRAKIPAEARKTPTPATAWPQDKVSSPWRWDCQARPRSIRGTQKAASPRPQMR